MYKKIADNFIDARKKFRDAEEEIKRIFYTAKTIIGIVEEKEKIFLSIKLIEMCDQGLIVDVDRIRYKNNAWIDAHDCPVNISEEAIQKFGKAIEDALRIGPEYTVRISIPG